MLAPTGTIGLVMDCDTTGVEPDFALVKFKKLAGGGYFKIINQSVPPALAALGYSDGPTSRRWSATPRGTARSWGPPRHQSRHACKAKGFTPEVLERVEAQLESAFDLKFVFNPWTLGRDFCLEVLGLLGSRGRRSHLRRASQPRVLPGRHRRCERLRHRHDDPGGGAAASVRAPRGVRLRQPLRPAWQALHSGGGPHSHDGGLPALPLRRDQQDHQHAATRPPSKRSRTRTCCPGASR